MADFIWKPHRVEVEKDWNVNTTEMVGMRKKTRLVSSLPIRRWSLFFRIQIQSEYESLLAHYDGQYGGTVPFYWMGSYIPDHINSANETYFNVRYTSFRADPVAWGVWEIFITLEEVL
jgi:hypothetical protein